MCSVAPPPPLALITLHCLRRLCRPQMLLEALILFTEPQQDQPLMQSSCDSLADGLSICEQAGQPAQLHLGFEQHLRAGSFKGRVELQVVRTTQQGVKLFAGVLLLCQSAELCSSVPARQLKMLRMRSYGATLLRTCVQEYSCTSLVTS